MAISATTRLWLAVAFLPGLEPFPCGTLKQLLDASAGGTQFTDAAAADAGLSPACRNHLGAFLQGRFPPQAQRMLERCQVWSAEPGHHILTPSSPDYPPLLLEIAEPPPVLFVAGSPATLALPQIGIVGSRSPTADGRRNARAFAMQLVAAGYQVTSGMALGIDTESHAGALDQQGRTIAVLGSGLDVIYPEQNARLAAAIIERGALVSEFLPDAPPDSWHFPRRNRIISGLSHGVLVVEAAQRSGSLITARLAAEQGREVFVLPGSIHNPMARGCHQLIRQGAKLVESVADILEELPALLAWEHRHAKPAQPTVGDPRPTNGDPQSMDEHARRLLACIAYDPASVDSLAQRSGMALPLLYSTLLQLEMRGVIVRQAAGYVLSPA